MPTRPLSAIAAQPAAGQRVPKPAAGACYLMLLLADIRMIMRVLAAHGLGIDTRCPAEHAKHVREGARSQTRRCEIFVACLLEPLAFTGSIPHRLECRFPPPSRCRQRSARLLEPVALGASLHSRSFNTTTSSIVSATSRLSFTLAIGLEPMAPQWLDFLKPLQAAGIRHVHAAILGLQLVKLAGLRPCLRQTSATVSPFCVTIDSLDQSLNA